MMELKIFNARFYLVVLCAKFEMMYVLQAFRINSCLSVCNGNRLIPGLSNLSQQQNIIIFGGSCSNGKPLMQLVLKTHSSEMPGS